jgi:hypothetical protein
MTDNIDAAGARALALQVASRVVPSGDPVGHYLSSARQFERYLLLGFSQTGPNYEQGMVAGRNGAGALVRVEGYGISADLADRIRQAVEDCIDEDRELRAQEARA